MDVSLDASMGGTDGLVVHVDKNRVGVRGCPIMTVREEKNTQMPSHGGMIIGVYPEMCFACFILLDNPIPFTGWLPNRRVIGVG